MTNTSKEALDALEKCPFCGGDAQIVRAEEAGPNAYCVCCRGCMASSRVIFPNKVDPVPLLIEAWNNRSDEVAAIRVTRERVEEVEKMMDMGAPFDWCLEELGLPIQDSEPQCSASWDGEECHADDCPKKPGAACPRRPFDYPSDTDSEPEGRECECPKVQAHGRGNVWWFACEKSDRTLVAARCTDQNEESDDA